MTPSSPDFAATKARMEREIAPAAARLDAVSRARIVSRAEAEGWPPEQALWIDRLAKQDLFQAVADGVAGDRALEQAYRSAVRRLTVMYYESWMEEGHSRMAAFLMLLNLERGLFENRGEAYVAQPDAIRMAACEAVEDAAGRGLGAAEQIDVGYAVIRKLSQTPLS